MLFLLVSICGIEGLHTSCSELKYTTLQSSGVERDYKTKGMANRKLVSLEEKKMVLIIRVSITIPSTLNLKTSTKSTPLSPPSPHISQLLPLLAMSTAFTSLVTSSCTRSCSGSIRHMLDRRLAQRSRSPCFWSSTVDPGALRRSLSRELKMVW